MRYTWPEFFARARNIEQVARKAGLSPARARALGEGLAARPLSRSRVRELLRPKTAEGLAAMRALQASRR